MGLSDRKKKILQIVVDDYIETAVPVSSKVISEKYMTSVSSATIRSELSALEELGYLTQLHTSSDLMVLASCQAQLWPCPGWQFSQWAHPKGALPEVPLDQEAWTVTYMTTEHIKPKPNSGLSQ